MLTSSGLPIVDLKSWGVDVDNVPEITGINAKLPCCHSLEEARAYCRSLAVKHYENFSVVSYLLPHTLRPHFYALYAYCRWADDLGDEIQNDATSLALLDWWEAGLHEIYEGKTIPKHPVFVALKNTVEEFLIPKTLFIDLITAFRQDRRVLEYETRAELLDYCRYSANPVGRLILYLARINDETSFIESDAICTGLQLANFWQDVARDWREKGRIYIPREDRLRFSYTDFDFKIEKSTPEFKTLLEEEVRWAKTFFDVGRPLINRVPKKFRLEIRLFHDGGIAILNAIRKQDFSVWEKRPRIGRWQKILLLLRALL